MEWSARVFMPAQEKMRLEPLRRKLQVSEQLTAREVDFASGHAARATPLPGQRALHSCGGAAGLLWPAASGSACGCNFPPSKGPPNQNLRFSLLVNSHLRHLHSPDSGMSRVLPLFSPPTLILFSRNDSDDPRRHQPRCWLLEEARHHPKQSKQHSIPSTTIYKLPQCPQANSFKASDPVAHSSSPQ